MSGEVIFASMTILLVVTTMAYITFIDHCRKD